MWFISILNYHSLGPMEPPKPSSDNTTPKTNSDKERKQAFKKELCENLKKVSKQLMINIDIIVLDFSTLFSFELQQIQTLFLDLDWYCDNVITDIFMGCDDTIS